MQKVLGILRRILDRTQEAMWSRRNILALAVRLDQSLQEIVALKKELNEAKIARQNPSEVIASILERGIKFYDYRELDANRLNNYVNDAKEILKSDMIQNERNHLVADLVNEIAKSDVDENRDKRLRYSINGIQLFFERLESISKPEDNKTFQNLHDII